MSDAPIDPGELHRRMAQRLDAMAIEVEAIGALLCSDGDLCLRFETELQGIDRLAQWQRSLAAILRAPTPAQARAACSLDEVERELFAGRAA